MKSMICLHYQEVKIVLIAQGVNSTSLHGPKWMIFSFHQGKGHALKIFIKEQDVNGIRPNSNN